MKRIRLSQAQRDTLALIAFDQGFINPRSARALARRGLVDARVETAVTGRRYIAWSFTSRGLQLWEIISRTSVEEIS